MIYRGAKVATVFDHADLKTKAFEKICSQNHIAPLVIICHVDAEKQAFLHGETYRKSIKPERECIFVVVCEMTHCDHKITDCNRLTAYTCDKEAMVIEKAIEKLLKRWAYMMLAERVNTIKLITEFTTDLSSSEFIQQLSNHGIEKEEGAWKHSDERIYLVRKLKELLEESRSLYSRNHLPTEDWPTFSPESKIPVKMIFDQIAKHHYVVGCGNRFGTLLILVDEKVENRNKIEETLQSEMKDFKMEPSDFALKYVSKRLRYFIKSGDTIDCNDEKSFGTLAGFALQDTNDNPAKQRLVALFSRHVADMCTESKLKVEGVIIGDILHTTDEGVDIAAAEVYAEHVDACNSKFVTEKNIEKTCGALDPYKVELAGMLVHLVGAASEEIGLGKIAVVNFYSKQAHAMNTILLENRVSNTHVFCEPGDSGAMILSYFPDDDKLMALGMLIGSVEKKNEEYTDKFAKPFTSSKKKVRAKNVQNDACQWYAAFCLKEGLEQLSKIHDGRFFLVGEKNNNLLPSQNKNVPMVVSGEN
ncbi:hypothetical protein MAR_035768 [Mya arenaria]|uniref:Uncharacterized protein n=2 Tax=Mya arenaria TaxID=6604 RepID=A0ABY7EP07_MYAAR|nr:hypothetical protein MAR_035768 [Mya arenaria]